MQRNIKLSSKAMSESLWRAVIIQALVMQRIILRIDRQLYQREKQKDWLKSQDESFTQTCLLLKWNQTI